MHITSHAFSVLYVYCLLLSAQLCCLLLVWTASNKVEQSPSERKLSGRRNKISNINEWDKVRDKVRDKAPEINLMFV